MSKTKLGLGILVGLTVFAVILIGQAGAIFPPGFDKVPSLPDKAYFGVFNNPNVDIGEAEPFIQDEIVVKFKGDEKPFRVIKVSEGKVLEKVKEYSQRADVVYAEPNYIAHTLMVPNDPLYSYQWHLDNSVHGGIQTEEAWEISTGSGVTVAIVDTGIAYENYQQGWKKYYLAPDLANTCFVPGYDFISNDSHPNDDNSHGTHVAGTVAQSTNNGKGVAGVAFNSCLMPVKVLNKNGSGTYTQVADGIRWAVDHGAQVINLSLGGSATSDVLRDAVAYAYNNGATVIAACGNDSTSTCAYPAAYDDYVIAVGATRYDETLSYYSNYGPSLDLVAPGGDLNVDQNEDGYGDGVLQNTFNPNTKNTSDFGYWFFQGTSMATPHVAGTAALLIAKGNATTPDKIRTALQETAKDKGAAGRDDTYGYGLIDVFAALNWIAGPPDIEAPVIAGATGNTTGTTGEFVTISATITDNIGVANAIVYYIPIDGTETTVAMVKEPDPSNIWKANLPFASNKVGEITYYLKARDAAGNEARDPSTGSYSITVTDNDPPIANAGPDQSSLVNATVTLSGSGSSDNIGITEYKWDFNASDGVNWNIPDATGVAAAASYATPGTYTVTLQVSDAAGLTDTDAALITVTETLVEVTVFSDSFEDGNLGPEWTQDARNDWFVSPQRAFDGAHSAEVDGSASNAKLISIPIDLQGRTNATITFSWYIESGLDKGEYLAFDVSTNGINSWVEKARLRGNIDPENTWQSVSIDLVGISNLKIQFRGKMSGSDEDANVDMVGVVVR